MGKIVYSILLALFLTGTLTLAFNIKPLKANWTRTIYVRADGSIKSESTSTSTDDITLPVIGKPFQWPPSNDVKPEDEVSIEVNVTDYESGVNRTILSYSTDNGLAWINITMDFGCYLPCNTWLYFASIPGKPAGTFVQYKIIAYDNAGNFAVEDNAGQYYTYTVIPEFPLGVLLLVLMAISAATLVFVEMKIARKLKT